MLLFVSAVLTMFVAYRVYKIVFFPSDPMEIVELEPLNPTSPMDLCENNVSRTDQRTRAVNSHKHPTSPVGKGCNNFTCFSDSEPEVVGEPFHQLSSPSPSWESQNAENATEGLGRVLISPEVMLERRESHFLVS